MPGLRAIRKCMDFLTNSVFASARITAGPSIRAAVVGGGKTILFAINNFFIAILLADSVPSRYWW
jgi:hypothetical protein